MLSSLGGNDGTGFPNICDPHADVPTSLHWHSHWHRSALICSTTPLAGTYLAQLRLYLPSLDDCCRL